MATRNPLDHALTEAPLWAPGHPFRPPIDEQEEKRLIGNEIRATRRRDERAERGHKKSGPKPSDLPFGLSARQLQAMTLLIEGKTHDQVARDMHASPKTVNEHVARAIERIGGTNRLHACVLLDRHLRAKRLTTENLRE